MKNKLDMVALALGVSRGAFRIEDAAACAPLWGRGNMSPCEALQRRGKIDPEEREEIESAALTLLDRHSGDQYGCIFSLGIDEPTAFRIQSLVEDASECTALDDEETMEGMLADTSDTAAALEETRPTADPDTGLRQSHPGRYVFVAELGRGGLGRVLDASDADIGRSVAIKMMLPEGVTPARVERFLHEARTTARLTHPNIVPVYDIGVLSPSEGGSPYFTMLKITGRDLRRILSDIRSGNQDTSARFTRQRLLGIFASVCDAVSFAHDKGVLHRDLKPGNVMVGEYGEVFVVDWGLALVKGSAEPASKPSPDEPATDSPDVAGSPAYMSPEQADGRTQELDERSDVYSLGAILYQILALVPAFHGFTVYNVLSRVIAGEIDPPSARLSKIQASGEAPGVLPVPGDLDAICLKAMARDKEDRFATARELGETVRKYLEGELEKEHNRRKAAEKIGEGRSLLESLRKENARLQTIDAQIRRVSARTPAWLPAGGKADLWMLEDDLDAARDSQSLLFTRAARAFQAALEFDRDNPEARAALADMYWERFIEEEQGSRRDKLVYEELVREFGDGRYDSRLQGDGRLSISVSAYVCGCLRDQPPSTAPLLSVAGLHPFTGSDVSASSDAPERIAGLKAHGLDCKTHGVSGADVWVFEMVNRGRVLAPVFPERAAHLGSPRPLPREIIDRCFEDASPYRPDLHKSKERPPGLALHLGAAPVDLQRFPMGSYLAVVSKEGFEPVRAPFRIWRQSSEKLDLILFARGEVPEGFVQISSGTFQAGGDRKNPYSADRHVGRTGVFFISRHPVTCAEYLEFLDSDPDGLAARAPRKTPAAGFYWKRGANGRFYLPTSGIAAQLRLDPQSSKLDMCSQWWRPDWPVLSVSGEDILAYALWRSAADKRVYSLPASYAWEKAARGADARPFPWGFKCDASFANYKDSHEDGIRPSPVTDFPFDESPYGVRGMSGNARECCIDRHPQKPEFRLWRGGAWLVSEVLVRATGIGAFPADLVNNYTGGRLAWYPVLPFEASGI